MQYMGDGQKREKNKMQLKRKIEQQYELSSIIVNYKRTEKGWNDKRGVKEIVGSPMCESGYLWVDSNFQNIKNLEQCSISSIKNCSHFREDNPELHELPLQSKCPPVEKRPKLCFQKCINMQVRTSQLKSNNNLPPRPSMKKAPVKLIPF